MFECSVYGLGLRVNTQLAGLIDLPKPRQIDVQVIFGYLPPGGDEWTSAVVEHFYSSEDLDTHGVPLVRVSRLLHTGAIRMAYADGTVFIINEQGSEVWATTPPGQTVEDTATYFLGPIMGLVSRLHGLTCLHASAVACDGQAIALVGTSGAGKSTTAAAFAKLGYPVLTDDVLSLTDCGDHFMVRPAYPRIRLWPKSVAGLFGSVNALPLITPGWDKRFLGLNTPGYLFQRDSLPLAAVYILGQRTEGTVRPSVKAVRPAQALMTLLADSYAADYVHKPMRAKEFEVLSRLVRGVPLRHASAPDNLSRVNEFCDVIVQDFQTQKTAEADCR